jgi:hypothetical protein
MKKSIRQPIKLELSLAVVRQLATVAGGVVQEKLGSDRSGGGGC